MGPVFPRSLAGAALSAGPRSDLRLGLLPGALGGFPTSPAPPTSMLSCRACSRVADPLSPSLLCATDPSPSLTSPIFPVSQSAPHPPAPTSPAEPPSVASPLQAAQRLLWCSHSDGRWLEEQLFLTRSLCLSSQRVSHQREAGLQSCWGGRNPQYTPQSRPCQHLWAAWLGAGEVGAR